jgi:spore coat protein CotH
MRAFHERLVALKTTHAVLLLLFGLVGCTETATNPSSPETLAGQDTANDSLTADIASESDSALLDSGPPATDPSDAIFELDRLLEVSVEIDKDDWDTLRKQTRTFADILKGDCLAQPFAKIFTYFPADVTIDGEVFKNVGVRKKGFFGSLSDTKPSLKIKFGEYEEEPMFAGMKRLTFNNSKQDPSHMNTCLSYKVYRDAGYPAPRCNFARVTVNGDYLGVYIHVDSIKKPFLKRQFGDDDGNLYEGQVSDFNSVFRNTFEKKTNDTENDWSDIDAATAAMSVEGPEGLALLKDLFDIDRFLTFWSIEVLVAHWDGYSGNRNNFYTYVDPAVNKFVFLPWGPDSAFAKIDNPFDEYDYPASVMANSTLAKRLYDDPAYRSAYHARLTELLETVWNEEALLEEVDRMEALIADHVTVAPASAFTNNIKRIRTFINGQRAAVTQSLAENPDFTHVVNESPCFKSAGSVAAEFETTFGSLGAANPLAEGSVTYSHFVVQEMNITPTTSGVVSGVETQGPSAGKLIVSLVNLIDGNIDILAFVMDPDVPEVGVSHPIDGTLIQGFALRVVGGQFQVLGNLSDGWLRFDAYEGTDGAVIKGALETKIY